MLQNSQVLGEGVRHCDGDVLFCLFRVAFTVEAVTESVTNQGVVAHWELSHQHIHGKDPSQISRIAGPLEDMETPQKTLH